MMKKKWKVPDRERVAPGWKDRATTGIAFGIVWVQRKWAEWMSRQTSGMSGSKLKAVTILFCMAGTAISIAALHQGIWGKNSASALRHTESISIPLALPEPQAPFRALDSATIRNLFAFEDYVDSLSKTPGGLRELDRVLTAHPGLLDSAEALKKMYRIK